MDNTDAQATLCKRHEMKKEKKQKTKVAEKYKNKQHRPHENTESNRMCSLRVIQSCFF